MPGPPPSIHRIRDDFPPYPAVPPSACDRLLDRLVVSGVTAIEWICAPAWSIPPRRIGDDMFFLILAGRARMRVEGRESALRPGDLAHWRRGRLHEASHDPAAPITVIALHYTALLEGAVHLADAAGFPDRIRLGRGHPIESLAREAAREYALRPRGWQRGLEATAVRIIMELLRGHGADLGAGETPTAGLARVLPALEAMRESLPRPFGMPTLARRCGLSSAQFRRLFARAVGCSPVAHLRRLRIAEACRLLRAGDQSIDEIAGRVGCANASYLASTFRAAMGMTPGAYRRQAGP